MKENCGGKNYGCFACTAQLARVQEEHRYNHQRHQERKGKEERELKQNDCIHSVRCEQSSPIICLVIEVIKRCGSHEGRACCYPREHVGNISQPAGHEFLFRHWQQKKLTPFFGGIQ
jgi:hypothetical protein